MGNFIAMFWGSIFRRLLSVIGLLAGVIVAVPPAAAIVSDWQPIAFKAYVQSVIQAKIDPMLQTESRLLVVQAQQQQTLNQIYLSQLQSSLYAAKRDMAAAPTATVQERINELEKLIDDTQKNSGNSR